jgi:hypothetical protein
MKKIMYAAIMFAMIAAVVFAQEEEEQQTPQAQEQQAADPRAAMAAAMAAEGIKRPGEITTPMGTITLHGMVMTGLQGYMANNTAVDGDEKDWSLQAWDPVWQENAAKMSLTYNNGKYGGYIMIAAEDWSGHVEEGFNNVYMPYFFIWRGFFDNKLKVSIGKLYGEDYQTRERIWKTEGASQGGWQFSDSNNYLATRIEFNPLEGLSLGAQWNFLPMGQSVMYSMAMSVSYTALMALGNSYLKRSLSGTERQSKVIAGSGAVIMFFGAASSIMLPQLMSRWGTLPGGWTRIGFVYGLPMMAIGMLRFIFIKENVATIEEDKQNQIGIKEGLKLMFSNKYAMLLAGASVLDNIVKFSLHTKIGGTYNGERDPIGGDKITVSFRELSHLKICSRKSR